MINRYEAIGIFSSIAVMILVIFMIRTHEAMAPITVAPADTGSTVTVASSSNADAKNALYSALVQAISDTGAVNKLIVDDITNGTGTVVKTGDTVTVNYIGMLKNGSVFDSSYAHGSPFTFTVGDGKVIKGWDQGLVGMKVGGKRILVVPPALGYGSEATGPIPADSVLVFGIQLLDVTHK